MKHIFDMGFDAFEKRDELRRTLSFCVAKGLADAADAPLLCDFSFGETEYTASEVLSNALALAEILKTSLPAGERLGLVMPPSFRAIVANYACLFAKIIPVNLNFTLGEASAKSCLQTGKISAILTAEDFYAKITKANPRFPWTDTLLDFAQLQSKIKVGRIEELAKLVRADFNAVAQEFGIEEYSKDLQAEGTLVFTSGSEGNPKAAVLTQRNIIANCLQIRLCELFEKNDVLMANLPIFHSFGLLFEVWYLAIFAQYTVTLISPLDVKGNIQAIKQKGVSVIIGTPTFYRPYLKYATAADMKSLRMAIAGAEKTPHGFEELWNSRFGDTFKEGYGLTEASPVVGVNLPKRDMQTFSTGTRKFSIGKLFPGMRARILDAETKQELPFGEQGLLALQGANVFKGYLNNKEATDKTLIDGWLVTGDLSRIDADGFLFIDGRLSRFSKIGAEMVPHATVEATLIKELGFENNSEPMLAISSKLDEAKGEALVLLTVTDISLSDAKNALRKAGLSNLWHPKYVLKVDKIPVLASGKFDLRAMADLAKLAHA